MEVTVLIVSRNEEKHILNCINSIEKQFSHNNDWELIFIDGISHDRTKIIAKNYLEKKAKYKFKIFDNEKKILSAGWNIGIKNAKGKYIIRPDAHATLEKNYINKALEILKNNPKIAVVGGILITKAKGFWGDIIKNALSTKVGVGNSSFRTGAKSSYQDTAVYGLYKKEVFDKSGFFNENLKRHQDTEFHQRAKENNFKFWLQNDIKANYFCRNSIYKLLKQMFQIGRYLPVLIKIGQAKSIKIRHFAPFGFYFFLFVNLIFGKIFEINFLLKFSFFVFISYISVIFVGILQFLIKGNKFKIQNLLLIFIIPLMHLFYGLGFFIGLIRLKF